MAWDIERWDASTELAETDDTNGFENEVIDASWSYVEPEPSYEMQPEPEPSRHSWNTPVGYEEPDVIDTPFAFLEPDESQYPVKKNTWGWGNDDKQTTQEIERYTSAWLTEDEPEVQDADYTYIDPETRGIENPYRRSTDDFFRTVEVGENEPQRSWNPFADFWGETTAATSQASNTWQSNKSGNKRDTRADSSHDPKWDSYADEYAKQRSKPREDTSPRTSNKSGSSPPSGLSTKYQDSKGVKPSLRGKGGADKDYPWYYLAYPDPRESEDIQYLRYWYLLYEYSDGIPEWDDIKFQQWAASLKGADRDLYIRAGQQIADNELIDNLKNGDLKTAYQSMRLEGDDGEPAYKDPVGHMAAWFLRGFS